MAGAVANSNAVTGSTYLIPQVTVYGYVAMDGKVWRNGMRSKDDAAFIDYAKKQWDDGLETFMQECARMAYGRKTGARALTSATVAPTGSTITMAKASDLIFFRKGMIIVASETDGGALAAGTPGYATITGIVLVPVRSLSMALSRLRSLASARVGTCTRRRSPLITGLVMVVGRVSAIITQSLPVHRFTA
jgi:hypothetical protein